MPANGLACRSVQYNLKWVSNFIGQYQILPEDTTNPIFLMNAIEQPVHYGKGRLFFSCGDITSRWTTKGERVETSAKLSVRRNDGNENHPSNSDTHASISATESPSLRNR